MKILLATSNQHKVEEIRRVFEQMQSRSELHIELVGLSDLAVRHPQPAEDCESFEGNAKIKALHYARLSGHLSLADDSGLQVNVLHGAPGVRSARYAGVGGRRHVADQANNALLLKNLGDTPSQKRTAHFVCAMVLCAPMAPTGHAEGRTKEAAVSRSQSPVHSAPTDARVVALVRAEMEGRILGPGDEGYHLDMPSGRGTHGFGYDPLFLLPDVGKTTAELEPDAKNRDSHRGRAARKMWNYIARIAGSGF